MQFRGLQTALRTGLCLVLLFGTIVVAGETEPPIAASVKLQITNRLHPQFLQTTATAMGVLEQIGDTDLFFEVTKFYPHFAIMDSTKEFVSLSEEPKNPTFRIAVFESDSLVEETWAFFNLMAPHFSANSYIVFDVTEFVYRGVRFRKGEEPETLESK